MVDIKELLKYDNRQLGYIDSNDVYVEKFSFSEVGKIYNERIYFYRIDGINDYIIKDSTKNPLFFNNIRNKNLLRNLVNKQSELPDIGFPIGYYKHRGRMTGTIIPYYVDATSIKKLIYIETLDNLPKYYNHDSNESYNLISLFLEILEVIHSMYKKGVIYTDIHAGNFLVKDNEVKIIDFESGFIFFNDKKGEHLERLLYNYAGLIETICYRYGFKKVMFNRQESFYETEQSIKVLRKELER